MHTKFVKLFSFVMAIAISLGASTAFAFAANESDKMSLSVESVVADLGDSVKVKIDLNNNSGISSLKFNVEYDDALTLTKVELGSDFPYATAPVPYKNPQTISMISPIAEVTANGTVATLTFTVSESAPAGYSAKIHLTYDPEDVFDDDFNNVDCDIFDGEVKINGASAPSVTKGHVLSVSGGEAEEGEVATLTVLTDSEVSKLRFVDADGNTLTVRDKTINADGTKLWKIEKAYSEGVYSYSIFAKIGECWVDEEVVGTLTFTSRILESGRIVEAEYDDKIGAYKLTVDGRATKLQFIDGEGMTRTYTRYHDATKKIEAYDAQGNKTDSMSRNFDHEIWYVNARLYSGDNYKVIAKFESGWNKTDSVNIIAH